MNCSTSQTRPILSKGRAGVAGWIFSTRFRKCPGIDVRIIDEDFPHVKEVDAKLVVLAKKVGGRIVTNDLNLNKVAELQGVRVLNINELCNALQARRACPVKPFASSS
jgi:uncharacterized protein YacL